MANLTITVDDESLKKARFRALEERTSVSALLRDFLESYAGVSRSRQEAIREIVALSRRARSRRGEVRRSRDDLCRRR